jgi:hypothetical protein
MNVSNLVVRLYNMSILNIKRAKTEGKGKFQQCVLHFKYNMTLSISLSHYS